MSGKVNVEVLWNVLGIFKEDIDQRKSDSNHRIEYTTPKEFIWSRRRNLNGAKLRVGYVESLPYLRVVSGDKEVLTGNELISGNTVNANKIRLKMEYLKFF